MIHVYRALALVVAFGFAGLVVADPLASRHGLQAFPPSQCADGNFIQYVAAQHGYICNSISGGGGTTSVVGTAPVASSCTGGTCTVSLPAGGTVDVATLKIGGITAMGPSSTGTVDIGTLKIGGITAMGPSSTGTVDIAQLKIGGITAMGPASTGTVDIATLKIGGVTAIGPSHTGTVDIGTLKIAGVTAIGPSGFVYDTSSTAVLSVSQALGSNTVNLSTVGSGSTDWIAPNLNATLNTCDKDIQTKISGHHSLACIGGVYPVYVYAPGGGGPTLGHGNSGGCTIGVTWNQADTSSALIAPTSTTCNYNNIGYSPVAGDYGYQFVIPATTSQQVARIYTSWFASTGQKCDGSLTDGSGLTASTPTQNPAGGGEYHSDTWTFRATKPNTFLVVYCHMGTPTGAGGSTAWLGVAVVDFGEPS